MIREKSFETNSSSTHALVFPNDWADHVLYGTSLPKDKFQWIDFDDSDDSADEGREAQSDKKIERKTLELFSWLPQAASNKRKEAIENQFVSEKSDVDATWYRAVLEDWFEDENLRKSKEAKAEELVMLFPALESIEVDFAREIEEEYHNVNSWWHGHEEEDEENESFVLLPSLSHKMTGRFICREQIIALLESQLENAGYDIEYAIPREMLTEIIDPYEDSNGDEAQWGDELLGVGACCLAPHSNPSKFYNKFARWLLSPNALAEFVLDDRCFGMETLDHGVTSASFRLAEELEDEFHIAQAPAVEEPLCYETEYMCGEKYSAPFYICS